LRGKVTTEVGALPISVAGWVAWIIKWLGDDAEARSLLLEEVRGANLGAVGERRDGVLTEAILKRIQPALIAWVEGEPLRIIEEILGGDPASALGKAKICPRARDLVQSVIPRGFSFVVSLVAHLCRRNDAFNQQEGLDPELFELLRPLFEKGSIPSKNFSLR
jgi:hypothetical protein